MSVKSIWDVTINEVHDENIEQINDIEEVIEAVKSYKNKHRLSYEDVLRDLNLIILGN